MSRFEHDGKTYEYDPDALREYGTIKALSLAGGLGEYFKAVERVFCGHDGEYFADATMDDVGGAVTAAIKAAGAKN